jgi:TATA-box binding protein (TBP) (component of TFIID and TFIIIB)
MGSVLREIYGDLQEFGEMNGDELDDLANELNGESVVAEEDDDEEQLENQALAGAGIDDDDDLFDDNARARKALALERQRRAADERIEKMMEQERLEKQMGFIAPVRRQIISLRKQRPYDCWLSSAGARTMYDDDAHATEMVLAHINQLSPNVNPPPSGLGRAFDLPKKISAIRFDPWVAYTTTEVVDTNSVATFYTGLLPDLASVAHRAVACCFNIRRFAACKTTMEEGTILLFCGSAVCTGPKGPSRSNAQCQRYVMWLNQLGIPATMQGYRLQNLVSKASAGWEVDLNLLHTKFPFNAQYKPLRFPGVIFRLDFESESKFSNDQGAAMGDDVEDKVVAIIFKSTKTIITGSRVRAKTRIVWTYILNTLLREFKRDTSGSDVRVTEAAYRRMVSEERSIIDYTCRNINRIASERANYDMLVDNPVLADVKSEFDEAARCSRKRSFADTLGEFFTSDDAAPERKGSPSSLARVNATRVAAIRRDPAEMIAKWVACNTPLINH